MLGLAIGVLSLCIGALAQTPPEGYAQLPRGEGWYRGEPVKFRVYQGQAIVEGDILLGPLESVLTPPPKDAERLSTVRSGDRFRWTDRVIPYEIDPTIPNPARITDAVAHWNNRTVIRMKPREGEANFVRFNRAASGCNSNVGMIGGSQPVNLADNCSVGNIIHEIGHSVGLFHTQGRNDRSGYVTVLYENIIRDMWDQFDRSQTTADDVGPYDYGAIMHYSQWSSFNLTPRNAIQSTPPGIPIGQRAGLSAAEVQAVARIYGEPVREVVIDTFPSGLNVVVDGQTVRTPQSFQWSAGETHRLQAIESVATTSANTQYRFARWSDGAAIDHDITVNANTTVYLANYAQYMRLRTGVAPEGAGSVDVTPFSPDGLYPVGTTLLIRATPNEGFRFFRWTAGSGAVTYLAANEQGNGSNPVELTVRTDTAFYVANFLDRDFSIIGANAPGTLITVDNQQVYAPVHADWTPGSNHSVNIAATRTVTDAGVRYQFQGWSNGGDRQQDLTITEPVALTANVVKQYRLARTLVASRPAGAPLPGVQNIVLTPGGDGWYDEGSIVEIHAQGPDAVPFSNWFEDTGGKTNPQNIVLRTPALIGANFNGVAGVNSFSIVNDASQQPLELAPGMRFTIYTPGIGSDTPVEAQLDFPATLAGIGVVVGTERAGIVRVERNTVTAVAPATLPDSKTVTIVVEANGQRRGVVVPVQPVSPGVYTMEGTGRGAAANPAARGVTIRVTATGLNGAIPGAEVGGVPAEVLSVNAIAPGRTEVELRIPNDAPVGPAVPVILTVNGARSQVTATVAIE